MHYLSIYKASAGSGKTYKLAEFYLQKIIDNPEAYRNILAVTFTHKATAEMKSRIIGLLDEISKSTSETDLIRDLNEELNLNIEEIKKRAKKALLLILHDYSFFNISTIDSFFQKIIRAFTREIGLQTGLTIELDTEKVLSDVVQLLFLDIEENEDLKAWMIEFAKNRIEDGKSWNFSRDLQKFGKEVFKEKYLEYENKLVDFQKDKKLIHKYQQNLYAIIKDYEKTIIDLGNLGLKYIQDENLTIDDFKYKKSGPANYFNKLVKLDVEQTSRVRDALSDAEFWTGPKSEKREQIILLAEKNLNPLINKVSAFVEQNLISYNSAKVILKNIFVLGIVSDLSRLIKEYSADKGIFLLSDASKFLKEIINGSEIPFIYEKVGNYFNHYIIDEFQDTSEAQWDNFKPLIENSLAQGYKNLVVGDVKQSIYRWRNGNWKLLSEEVEAQLRPDQTKVEHLEYNWRSKRNVIDFNNSLFKHASTVLDQEIDSYIADPNKQNWNTGRISFAYQSLEQKTPDKPGKDGGFIKVNFIEGKHNSPQFQEESLDQFLKQINAVQDAGYQAQDIAILVRRQSEGKQIARFLLEQKKNDISNSYNYDVISNETLFLSSSLAINLIVSILSNIKTDSDQINNFYILTQIQKLFTANKISPSYENLFWKKEYRELTIDEEKFSDWINSLRRLPMLELVDQIIVSLQLNQLQDELPYLLAFQDIIKEMVSKGKAEINSFLNWWTDNGHKQTISLPDKINAMSVLTIHKAKGLQFKVVLIPFCNWKLDHDSSKSPILWLNASTEPFSELPVIPVSYEKLLNETIFQKDYLEEKLQSFVDNLNLLYVAFTRAEEALIVNAEYRELKKSDDESKLNSISELVKLIMQTRSESDNLLHANFQADTNSFTYGELQTQMEQETADIEMFTAYNYTNYHDKLKLRLRSEDYFKQEESKQRSSVNYGKLMHEIFASVNSVEEVDDALDSLINEGKLLSSEKQNIGERIKKALDNDLIKSWFSEDYKSLNEIDILSPSESNLRPDKVLISEDEVIVIDYKFGSLKQNKYNKQVANYMDHIKQMDYKKVKGYLWYFELDEIVEVEIEQS